VSATDIESSGELRWNIKQSFRDYVAELPDGKETWTSDIGGIEDGDLVFPAVAMTADNPESTHTRTFKFGGAVRYAGYRGMLRVDITDPWVEVGEASATLTADTSPPGVPSRRTAIAVTDGAPTRGEDGAFDWHPTSTRLTASGAALLGSVYPAGTEAAGFAFHVVPS
jgi:hypothetical protein